MLLGCSYLKERDQHISLVALARKNKKDLEKENKIKIGCYLTNFKKAITDGKSIYSFRLLFQWDLDMTKKKRQQGRSILDEIEERDYHQAIIFSNFLKHGCIAAHAYTVKKLDKGWVLLDCGMAHPMYTKPAKGQKRWNTDAFFSEVVGSDVYVLEKEQMSSEEFKKRLETLSRLMTKNYADIRAKRSEGVKKTNKRRRSHLMAHQKSKRTSRAASEKN